MFPMALVTGNTSLMKPSERDPGACMMLMELVKEAGFPDGVVNVIHGRHDCKTGIRHRKKIKHVSNVFQSDISNASASLNEKII